MKTGSHAEPGTGSPGHGAPTPAVRRLLSLLDKGQPRVLVALAGLPGSGKTTLAARWAEEVNRRAGPTAMQVLSMDGFHLSRAALARLPEPALALARRGAPWTFDPAALRRQLLALHGGLSAPVPWPDFQHHIGDPVPDVFNVPPETRLVLVEGLYLLHRGDGWDLQELFDEAWFLDVPSAQAMAQLLQRHRRAWQVTAEEAQARIDANDGLNAVLVEQTRMFADWLAPAL
jgi:pantothenate kinase